MTTDVSTYGRAPMCGSCRHRHVAVLPCWRGRYVGRVAAAVWAEYGRVCVHCGLDGSTTVEHVRPRSWGGTDALANLRPAHFRCNVSRGTRPMVGWAIPTSSKAW